MVQIHLDPLKDSMKDFNASNEPESCLWCGDKLRHAFDTQKEKIPDATRPPTKCGFCDGSTGFERCEDGTFNCKKCGENQHGGKVYKVVAQKRISEKPGYIQNGFFCSLRCGFNFGVSLADHGRRLAPKKAS